FPSSKPMRILRVMSVGAPFGHRRQARPGCCPTPDRFARGRAPRRASRAAAILPAARIPMADHENTARERQSEWFEKQSIGQLPAQAARRWGPREAICFKDRRVTFMDLADGVDRSAKGLLALGVEAGDKVALWMLN